ncbi:uncharacterized protein A1O5_12640 [Cladophialophora psammophila CBS 110553]|uniref:Uncharacterized protein n=1 Tax=Cladophialophora psammophila CBS 110553 TaxID=1182543 RepID=W9VLJ3_9EURO|nr:uncharacterized protein A1O5_12640 [Cladophialophora psammophila CBS 110553]EXJ56373.1 hypothetical protein A1O5_12640 [Cladophialophora psammophila CBS 110553]
MHVIERVACWLPKTQDVEEWARFFSVHERFGMEKALTMIRAQTQGPTFRHPSEQDGFAKQHGFNPDGMKAEARSADEIFPETASKELREAKLKDQTSVYSKPGLLFQALIPGQSK